MENEQISTVTNEVENKGAEKKGCVKKPIGKKILSIIALFLCIVLAFIGGYFSRYIFDPEEISKTHDLMRLIEKYGYVLDENGEPVELDQTDYARALVDGLFDQYSRYYTKEEYLQSFSEKSGNRKGFGVTIYNSESMRPQIISVTFNSPAEKCGIIDGDIVTSAFYEGQELVEFTNSKQLNDFLSLCPEDKVITFNLLRNTQNLTVEMQKADYKASYVVYYDNQRKMSLDVNGDTPKIFEYPEQKMSLPDDTALIKLSKFEGGVSSQLNKALAYMQEKGRTKLILDLRDNGGGYMTALCDVAGQLIYNGGKKMLVAYAGGKTDSESFYTTSKKHNSFINKISVLANDGTASASECLIGAMLYYGENFSLDNLVVEKNSEGVARTYGKGIMQTTYLLYDNSAVKLTTARIFWPDKTTCIHSKGILPKSENATEKGQSAVDRAISILQD